MTKAQRDAARRKRADEANAGKPCEECNGTIPGHAETCSKYVKPPKNLDDALVQQAILEPQPLPVTIGGTSAKLYPLPADEQCDVVFSFVPALMQAVAARGPVAMDEIDKDKDLDAKQKSIAKGSLAVSRYARTLVEEKELKARFVRFIARSEHAPDADPDDAELDARAKAIGKTMRPIELVFAFTEFCSINEVFGPPGNPPTQQSKKTG